MMRKSVNDNHLSEGNSAALNSDSRIEYFGVIDAMLEEAASLSRETQELVVESLSGHRSRHEDLVGVLIENRNALLVTTRLSHVVAWLLAVKAVVANQQPVEFLSNFDLTSVSRLLDTPDRRPVGSDARNRWAVILMRSTDLFLRVERLGDHAVKRSPDRSSC